MNPQETSGRTPIEGALSALSSDALLQFLARQRWFSGKASVDATARIDGTLVVPWGLGAFAIARVVVESGGETTSYQVPLAARDTAPPRAPEHIVVARGESGGNAYVAYDAMYDEDFRGGLVRAVQSGGRAAGDDASQLVVDRYDDTPLDDARTRLGAAEQSNTSVIVGDMAILKLYRILSAGANPDVDVGRFLTTRTDFRNTPRLIAALRLEQHGEPAAAGMVQQYLPGASDAWTYALERGRSYFAAPGDRDAPNVFADDAAKLGAVTRAMHEALGSRDDDPDFAAEPALPEDLDRWSLRAQQAVRDSLALLERQMTSAAFPRERIAEAQALVKRQDHYVGWINEIADHLGEDLGMRTRTHGDYHLGQVLRTPAGEFMIIDFEGEPARPLAERVAKRSPLRDVAGMLRSFGYAAATLAQSAGKNTPPHVRELRTGRWERDTRAAFLAAYFASDEDAGDLLPESYANASQLITLFETEKAFYELAYELNNRPSWVWVPMRSIAKLFIA